MTGKERLSFWQLRVKGDEGGILIFPSPAFLYVFSYVLQRALAGICGCNK